jgi:hypothetical protein
VNSSQFGSASDTDDGFTLVLNEEAIHWSKQTSDLRQSSPTRPSFTGQHTPDSYSYLSPLPTSRSKLHLPTKLTTSPFRSSTQSTASPTKSDGWRTKLDQKTSGRFGFNPSAAKVKSPGLPRSQSQQQEESTAMFQI